MDNLKAFASYILDEKLDEVVDKQLQIFSAADHYLKSLPNIDETEYRKYLKIQLSEFLSSITEGSPGQYITERLEAFRKNELDILSPGKMSLSEFIEAASHQKKAIIYFPSFFYN